MKIHRLKFKNFNENEPKYTDKGMPLPEGVMINEDGNPIWVDPDKGSVKPIDKFKLDEPSEYFLDEKDKLPPSAEKKLEGQMKAINQGYAVKDKPPFDEKTHYLNKFQNSESGLPYSKRLVGSNRFNYSIEKPKKEGGKNVSHVEPVDCRDHKWRGTRYGHDQSGKNLQSLSDKNLSLLKALGKTINNDNENKNK